MPLFADGLKKIRSNLELVKAGERPLLQKVGHFTELQLAHINACRAEDDLLPINPTIVFVGKHLYKSRCIEDGYSIDEVMIQIEHAFSDTSEVVCNLSTVLRNTTGRVDSSGNRVFDEAVIECQQKHPSPELFSVVPRGDGKRKAASKRRPF